MFELKQLKEYLPQTAIMITMIFAVTCLGFEEDPVFQGKKLTEWESMLKVDAEYEKLPEAEKEKKIRSRRAGLIALELLCGSQDKRILPAMEKVLKTDPEEKLRETAALSMTRVALKIAEKSKSNEPRTMTVRALIEALEKDKSIKVKEAAASSLGKIIPESAQAIPNLISAIKQKNTGLRVAATDSLRRLGPEAKEAAPDLRGLAGDNTADIISRSFSFLALGNLKDVPSLPILLQTVQDAKMPIELRLPAANAISMLGESSSPYAEKIGELLVSQDTPKDLKISLVIALVNQGALANPAWKAIVAALKDRDAAVRSLCLHCLGNMGSELKDNFKTAQSAVIFCVNDSALEVRLAAVGTLGRWGAELSNDEVLNKLQSLTKDSSKEMRETAEAVLKKLKQKN